MVLYQRENARLKKWDKKFFIPLVKRNNFSFAHNTTFGCGGYASWGYFPRNTLQAVCAFAKAKSKGKVFFLGNGSNVLAADGVFQGSVICTKHMQGITLVGNRLICRAGTFVGTILSFAQRNDLSGAEFLTGIPATVGGLVCMNGGVQNAHMQNIVSEVTVWQGKLKRLSNAQCKFGEKDSIFKRKNLLILSCNLSLTPSSPQDVAQKTAYYTARRAHLPKGRSCGCVFKNPAGTLTAGQLIEGAGCKGKRVGDAFVSSEHANFIINQGNCASHVFKLIEMVKMEVYKKYAVRLQEEVVYVGDML